jgi:hypothetical protein
MPVDCRKSFTSIAFSRKFLVLVASNCHHFGARLSCRVVDGLVKPEFAHVPKRCLVEQLNEAVAAAGHDTRIK